MLPAVFVGCSDFVGGTPQALGEVKAEPALVLDTWSPACLAFPGRVEMQQAGLWGPSPLTPVLKRESPFCESPGDSSRVRKTCLISGRKARTGCSRPHFHVEELLSPAFSLRPSSPASLPSVPEHLVFPHCLQGHHPLCPASPCSSIPSLSLPSNQGKEQLLLCFLLPTILLTGQ